MAGCGHVCMSAGPYNACMLRQMPTIPSQRAALQPCAAGRRGGASGGARRKRPGGQKQHKQQDFNSSEEVELFSIDEGWNVQALEDLLQEEGSAGLSAALGLSSGGSSGRSRSTGGRKGSSRADSIGVDSWEVAPAAADDGWSVDSVVGSSNDELDASWDEEDEEEQEDWQEDEEEEEDWGEDEGWEEARQEAPAAASGSGRRQAPGAALAQEQLLRSVPRHLLRRLQQQQEEADAEAARLKPAALKKERARQRVHTRLRIIAGSAAGRRLRSPQGDQTRPMMEMVRNAVFNMLLSLSGASSAGSLLPSGSRWLDLFAGTGAIGIEALSRGAEEAHFVELSPWVISNCLRPNLEACEVEDIAVIHSGKAEDFLRRAAAAAQAGGRPLAGGAFDFLSVCPPYELVDYSELYDLLDASPLLHEESMVVVEYPKKLAHLIRPQLGPLIKLRDRRYGRTLIAVYGPAELDPAVAASLQQS